MFKSMSITVEVLSDDDRPLVVKRADEVDAERLRGEADRLGAASHPGVVQVISSARSADGWELRTVHAGRPVEVVGPLSTGQVAAIGAALATTVADLHASGVVHGRIDGSHVLIGGHGRPVLCGFGAGDPDVPATPADDVAAIGDLITSLLGADGEAEPIPDRRWRPRRGWTGWERRALLTLADQACLEPATRRPTARRLAAAIGQAVTVDVAPDPRRVRVGSDGEPRAALPDPFDALRAPVSTEEGRSSPRLIPVVLAALGVSALVLAISRGDVDTATPTDAPPSAPAPAVSPAVPTTPASSPMAERAPCGPVGGVDLDGDGCREEVAVDGQTVMVGEDRFRVGERGDQVAVRDWDCDGQPTPAVFRPSTGEVFVFREWNLDVDVMVEPIATVAGGTELVLAPSSERCSGLAVRTADAVVDVVRSAT